jgi:hypothetical protein
VKRGFNHFPAVIKTLPGSAERMVDRMTTDVAAGAGATAPIDTGALAASYNAETDGLTGIAGSNMEYAPHVEYGTRHMASRPHLRPAADEVDNNGGAYARQLEDEINDAARSGRA